MGTKKKPITAKKINCELCGRETKEGITLKFPDKKTFLQPLGKDLPMIIKNVCLSCKLKYTKHRTKKEIKQDERF